MGNFLASINHSRVLALLFLLCLLLAPQLVYSQSSAFSFDHLSTATGDLSVPSSSLQQTAALILDINRDGVNDFVIGARLGAPALVWYRRTNNGWKHYVIDDTDIDIEAGGTYFDIDGDKDLDVVMGGDALETDVWWWENPYPNYDPDVPWVRHLIKNGGAKKHHDQIFGDIDGDGKVEFIFWNQLDDALFIADIPDDPRNTEPWDYELMFAGTGEGLAVGDVDRNGVNDLIAGGIWFSHVSGTTYTPHPVDLAQSKSRMAVADIIPGGNLEIVMSSGDSIGPLKLYTCDGDPTDSACWVDTLLLPKQTYHAHTLAIVDFNGDGNLDVFTAEMRLNDDNDDAKMWIILGDGAGNFEIEEIASGFGNHETKVGDLDGDGDIDILGKPYNWDTPRLDIWLNRQIPQKGRSCTTLPLDVWNRQEIDSTRPWRAVFVRTADIDGDNFDDVITGGWWYRNPGIIGADWERNAIGDPLNNVAVVGDFDRDGDIDIFGTQGKHISNQFAWAQNDGDGNFTVMTNIEDAPAASDFLQGAVLANLGSGNLDIALSWHAFGQGVQRLKIPLDPTASTWAWDLLSTQSLDEDLSAGDIDKDGDIDLLLGTAWLRNESPNWTFEVIETTAEDADRNRLVDMNKDGLLDAVVGFEAISVPGQVVWYEQTAADWIRHDIATVIGGHSLDVADMDSDGDLDVIVGEHNLADPASARQLVFQNSNKGTDWKEYVVYVGDEHHDGSQVFDYDRDGDIDIVSIGWGHNHVNLYTNRGGDSCGSGGGNGSGGGLASRSVTGTQDSSDDPAGDDASALIDPSLNMLGFAQPISSGGQGGQIRWFITIFNPSATMGNNIVLTNILDSNLSIGDIQTNKGTISVDGQTVSIHIGSLAPNETVQIQIFTRGGGTLIDNTACITGDNVREDACVTSLAVTQLPSTGEKQTSGIRIALVIFALLSSVGIGKMYFRKPSFLR